MSSSGNKVYLDDILFFNRDRDDAFCYLQCLQQLAGLWSVTIVYLERLDEVNETEQDIKCAVCVRA